MCALQLLFFYEGLDSSDASMAGEEDDSSIPNTPEAMVNKEIEVFKITEKEQDGACAIAIDVLKWWNKRRNRFL